MYFLSIEIAKKVFLAFDNVFHVYLFDEWIKKICKKKFHSGFFFFFFICYEMHMDRPDKFENIFETSYYLSKHLTFYVSSLISH